MFTGAMIRALLAGTKTQTRRIVKKALVVTCDDLTGFTEAKCPYGEVGDRLWVRETWMHNGGAYLYRADSGCDASPFNRWKSPLFMPRKASRFTLEVTAVRVEALHTISEDDAMAEGAEHPSRDWYRNLWESIHGEGSWEFNPWVRVITFRIIEQAARPERLA